MKIEKVKIPVYKNIIDGHKEVDIYVASDGKKFSEYDKNEAERYQGRLDYEKRLSEIKKVVIENNFNMVPSEWFYASNNEDLDFLVSLKEDRYRKVEVYGDLKDEEWIGRYVFNCGDSGETVIYYTLPYVMNEAASFLSEVMSKTNLIITDSWANRIKDCFII